MYKKQLSSLREKLNNRILRPILERKENTEINSGSLQFHPLLR